MNNIVEDEEAALIWNPETGLRFLYPEGSNEVPPVVAAMAVLLAKEMDYEWLSNLVDKVLSETDNQEILH